MSLIEERIDEDKHFVMIGDFECYENESLEIFLKSFAISYDKDSQGATYIIRNDDTVVAYYTLKCNAIQIQENGIQECVPVIELARRSEEHTSELQSRQYLVCRLLLEKKKKNVSI